MPKPPARPWIRALLKSIGAPVTPQNVQLLSNWQRWEGGHTNNNARFNWLNTTSNSPGAVKAINSVGVRAFKDFRSGVNALSSTLLNGRYNDIVAGLISGNPYKHDLSAGLSTWVSGSPTGNLEYARKVMGGGSTPKVAPAVGRGPKGNPGLVQPPPVSDLLEFAFDDDPEFLSLLQSIKDEPEPTPVPGPARPGRPVKGVLRLPTRWKATHETDGLGWGTKTAVDIMAPAGTPVGAPEDGVVVRWNPTGAQGGGSMWFKAKSGKTYWLGHLADGVAPGTRVKRGQVIATVSSDHPAPHVHLDVR
jgi:murein DD-endopeptidase MepM/ murein hydrolase activator NlpD